MNKDTGKLNKEVRMKSQDYKKGYQAGWAARDYAKNPLESLLLDIKPRNRDKLRKLQLMAIDWNNKKISSDEFASEFYDAFRKQILALLARERTIEKALDEVKEIDKKLGIVKL